MMKTVSWKAALKNGVVTGVISFAAFAIFTCFLNYFILDGITFYESANAAINGISFTTVNIIYVVLSAIVPVIFLRYEKIKFLLLNSGIAFVVFEVLALLLTVLIMYGIVNIFGLYVQYTFEILSYALVMVPVGSVLGTVIAIIINAILNEKKLS